MIVEFYIADWCGACKGLKPHIIAECNAQGAAMEFVDTGTDEGREYAEAHQVNALPTVRIVDNGQEVDRMVGNIGRYDFAKRLATAGKE